MSLEARECSEESLTRLEMGTLLFCHRATFNYKRPPKPQEKKLYLLIKHLTATIKLGT